MDALHVPPGGRIFVRLAKTDDARRQVKAEILRRQLGDPRFVVATTTYGEFGTDPQNLDADYLFRVQVRVLYPGTGFPHWSRWFDASIRLTTAGDGSYAYACSWKGESVAKLSVVVYSGPAED